MVSLSNPSDGKYRVVDLKPNELPEIKQGKERWMIAVQKTIGDRDERIWDLICKERFQAGEYTTRPINEVEGFGITPMNINYTSFKEGYNETRPPVQGIPVAISTSPKGEQFGFLIGKGDKVEYLYLRTVAQDNNDLQFFENISRERLRQKFLTENNHFEFMHIDSLEDNPLAVHVEDAIRSTDKLIRQEMGEESGIMNMTELTEKFRMWSQKN